MSKESDKLGAPQEFSEATGSPPAGAGAGPAQLVRPRSGGGDLRAQAANVIVKQDGSVLVTDNEGQPVARYTDRAAARTNLKSAGIDFARVTVVGNLGQDGPITAAPAKESKK